MDPQLLREEWIVAERTRQKSPVEEPITEYALVTASMKMVLQLGTNFALANRIREAHNQLLRQEREVGN